MMSGTELAGVYCVGKKTMESSNEEPEEVKTKSSLNIQQEESVFKGQEQETKQKSKENGGCIIASEAFVEGTESNATVLPELQSNVESESCEQISSESNKEIVQIAETVEYDCPLVIDETPRSVNSQEALQSDQNVYNPKLSLDSGAALSGTTDKVYLQESMQATGNVTQISKQSVCTPCDISSTKSNFEKHAVDHVNHVHLDKVVLKTRCSDSDIPEECFSEPFDTSHLESEVNSEHESQSFDVSQIVHEQLSCGTRTRFSEEKSQNECESQPFVLCGTPEETEGTCETQNTVTSPASKNSFGPACSTTAENDELEKCSKGEFLKEDGRRKESETNTSSPDGELMGFSSPKTAEILGNVLVMSSPFTLTTEQFETQGDETCGEKADVEQFDDKKGAESEDKKADVEQFDDEKGAKSEDKKADVEQFDAEKGAKSEDKKADVEQFDDEKDAESKDKKADVEQFDAEKGAKSENIKADVEQQDVEKGAKSEDKKADVEQQDAEKDANCNDQKATDEQCCSRDGVAHGNVEATNEQSCSRDGVAHGDEEATNEQSCSRDGVAHGNEEVTNEQSCSREGVAHGNEEATNEQSCTRDDVACGNEEATNEQSCSSDGVAHGNEEATNEQSCSREGVAHGDVEATNEQSCSREGVAHCNEEATNEQSCTRDGVAHGNEEATNEQVFSRDGVAHGNEEATNKQYCFKDGVAHGNEEAMEKESLQDKSDSDDSFSSVETQLRIKTRKRAESPEKGKLFFGYSSKKNKYKCFLCNEVKAEMNFKEHVILHLLWKPYKCLQCLKFFATRSDICAHMASNHSSNQARCGLRLGKNKGQVEELMEQARRNKTCQYFSKPMNTTYWLSKRKKENGEEAANDKDDAMNNTSIGKDAIEKDLGESSERVPKGLQIASQENPKVVSNVTAETEKPSKVPQKEFTLTEKSPPAHKMVSEEMSKVIKSSCQVPSEQNLTGMKEFSSLDQELVNRINLGSCEPVLPEISKVVSTDQTSEDRKKTATADLKPKLVRLLTSSELKAVDHNKLTSPDRRTAGRSSTDLTLQVTPTQSHTSDSCVNVLPRDDTTATKTMVLKQNVSVSSKLSASILQRAPSSPNIVMLQQPHPVNVSSTIPVNRFFHAGQKVLVPVTPLPQPVLASTKNVPQSNVVNIVPQQPLVFSLTPTSSRRVSIHTCQPGSQVYIVPPAPAPMISKERVSAAVGSPDLGQQKKASSIGKREEKVIKMFPSILEPKPAVTTNKPSPALMENKSKPVLINSVPAESTKPQLFDQVKFFIGMLDNYFLCYLCKSVYLHENTFKEHLWKHIHSNKSACLDCKFDSKQRSQVCVTTERYIEQLKTEKIGRASKALVSIYLKRKAFAEKGELHIHEKSVTPQSAVVSLTDGRADASLLDPQRETVDKQATVVKKGTTSVEPTEVKEDRHALIPNRDSRDLPKDQFPIATDKSSGSEIQLGKVSDHAPQDNFDQGEIEEEKAQPLKLTSDCKRKNSMSPKAMSPSDKSELIIHEERNAPLPAVVSPTSGKEDASMLVPREEAVVKETTVNNASAKLAEIEEDVSSPIPNRDTSDSPKDQPLLMTDISSGNEVQEVDYHPNDDNCHKDDSVNVDLKHPEEVPPTDSTPQPVGVTNRPDDSGLIPKENLNPPVIPKQNVASIKRAPDSSEHRSKSGKFFVCASNCGFSSLYGHELKKHAGECLPSSLACNYCHFVESSPETLFRHINKHSFAHAPGIAMLTCSVAQGCKFSSNILHGFVMHLESSHKNAETFSCSACGENFHDIRSLATHLECNILNIYNCKFCVAKSCTKQVMMNHISRVHPDKSRMVNMVKQLLCKHRKDNGYNPLKIPYVEKIPNKQLTSRTSGASDTNTSSEAEVNESIVVEIDRAGSPSIEDETVLSVETPVNEAEADKITKALPVASLECRMSLDPDGQEHKHISEDLSAEKEGTQEVGVPQKKKIIMNIPDTNVFACAVRCLKCKYSSVYKNNMWRHVMLNHPDIEPVSQKMTSPIKRTVVEKSPETPETGEQEVSIVSLGSAMLDTELQWLFENHNVSFKCLMCQRMVSKKKFLHDHLLQHLNISLWKCSVCDFRSTRRYSVRDHMQEKHELSIEAENISPLVDEIKQKVTGVLGKLLQGDHFILDVKPILGKKELNEELKEEYMSDGKKKICKTCQSEHQSLYGIHSHVLRQHLGVHCFKCHYCDYTALERYSVARHSKTEHFDVELVVEHIPPDIKTKREAFKGSQKLSAASGSVQRDRLNVLRFGSDALDQKVQSLYEVKRGKARQLICKMCGCQHPSKYSIHIHLLDHLQVELTACPYCSFGVNDPAKLTAHIRSLHPEEGVYFKYQEVDFDEAVQEASQKTKSLVNSPRKCPLSELLKGCKFSTSPEKTLKSPEKVRRNILSISVNGLKKFKCKLCDDYEALKKPSVARHILKKHATPPRSHEMKSLQTKNATSQNLEQHMLEHDPEEETSDSLCDREKEISVNECTELFAQDENTESVSSLNQEHGELKTRNVETEDVATVPKSNNENIVKDISEMVKLHRKRGRPEKAKLNELQLPKRQKVDIIYRCPNCEFSSMEKSEGIRHLQEEHFVNRFIQCAYCTASYTSEDSLKSHQRFLHKGATVRFVDLALETMLLQTFNDSDKTVVERRETEHNGGNSVAEGKGLHKKADGAKSSKAEKIKETKKELQGSDTVGVKKGGSSAENKETEMHSEVTTKKSIKVKTPKQLLSDKGTSRPILSNKKTSKPVALTSTFSTNLSKPMECTKTKNGKEVNKIQKAVATSLDNKPSNMAPAICKQQSLKVSRKDATDMEASGGGLQQNPATSSKGKISLSLKKIPKELKKSDKNLQESLKSDTKPLVSKIVSASQQKSSSLKTKPGEDSGVLPLYVPTPDNSDEEDGEFYRYICVYCDEKGNVTSKFKIHLSMHAKKRLYKDNVPNTSIARENIRDKVKALLPICKQRALNKKEKIPVKSLSLAKNQPVTESATATDTADAAASAHFDSSTLSKDDEKLSKTPKCSPKKKPKLLPTVTGQSNEKDPDSGSDVEFASETKKHRKRTKVLLYSSDEDANEDTIKSSPSTNRLMYCCHLCPYKADSLYKFRSHLSCHGTFTHLNPDMSRSTSLSCGFCNYNAQDKNDFSKHVEDHMTTRHYKCGYCKYESFVNKDIKRHLREWHRHKAEKIINLREIKKDQARKRVVAPQLVNIDPVLKVEDIFKSGRFSTLLDEIGAKTVDLPWELLRLFTESSAVEDMLSMKSSDSLKTEDSSSDVEFDIDDFSDSDLYNISLK